MWVWTALNLAGAQAGPVRLLRGASREGLAGGGRQGGIPKQAGGPALALKPMQTKGQQLLRAKVEARPAAP